MDLLDILLRTWVNARTTPGGLKVIPQSLRRGFKLAHVVLVIAAGVVWWCLSWMGP
jgi:hypothetical protein